ncbi:RNA polymerase II-associated protein 1 [Elysia marginata]|uniref:RNA polymerase II-associated protein 1 n=1 Tax=Elysia marginata TaxID=1093978 RepID=A0AAV4GD99_9GAST|nr:RNA polymerase II-associated protein 1 [Elysia marginata]
MNERPKPGEDEDDLLKLQQQFLNSGGSQMSSASIKRPDKRKTRDVVNMEGVQVESGGSQHNVKKSKFKQEQEVASPSRVCRAKSGDCETMEDFERAMDNKDSSVAAVLTSIIVPSNTKGGKTKKKSLFAQQVESQGPEHFGVDSSHRMPAFRQPDKVMDSETPNCQPFPGNSVSSVLDGSGLSVSNKKAEIEQIHQENVEKLTSMSEEEILDEQQKLLDLIDPKLLDFIKKKRTAVARTNMEAHGTSKSESFSFMREKKKKEKKLNETVLESELPLKPSKKWVHMDTLEPEKLEWIKDLPPPPSADDAGTGRPARFDFEGNVLAVDIDIPVNMGLHHHGEEPERAGYTLEEIFQLTRSSNLQQKTFAFHTLAKVISKAKSGKLSEKVQSPIIPTILSGGVLMLLRWGLDDSAVAVVAAAVDALHALLWNPLDEALVHRMDLLMRFRYIMESMHPQANTVISLLEILTRLAEHSSATAYKILKCPGLIDKIVKEFIPTAWSLKETTGPVSNVYGIPVPTAVKLLRVMCQCGRNIASILTSKYNIKLVLLRYLSVEISDLHLPLKEASNLQVEALALWRTCASYGLATETYFDLYSNITMYLGQLEKHWSTSSSSISGHRHFDTHLVCVLEKMLYVAGEKRSKSDESNAREDFLYEMNWSHVTSLIRPLLACSQKVLSDIGGTYPQQRQDLHFPTAGINFLASFYNLEGQQSGVDEVASLEGIEQFCSSCLDPLLDSYGFQLIVEKLSTFSNLLAAKEDKKEALVPHCLPSYGVFLSIETNGSGQRSETYTTNMPILSQHSPFGFLTAVLRLALSVSKRHKAMILKVLKPLVMNRDILLYMKKTCAALNRSQYSTSLFTRAENLLQYFWLKCCVLVPCDDMSIAHRVSLNLMSRLGHGDEHLIHDLITTVIFNQAFICEGSSDNLTSEAMASLTLSDSLHLKSATQEEISVSKSSLLQDVYNSLAKIRGHYLMAFGGMERAVSNSRNFFTGKPSETQSLLFKCAGESLMPKDWIYMPLIHVYNKTIQSQNVSGLSASPQSIAMVSSVLQWSFALEVWRPGEIGQVSATVRLSRILCAFIAGNDLFLERPVNHYLAGLLREFSTQRVLDRLSFEEKIPGMTSFYDLYQEVLDHYEAVSFGDAVFGLFVLLPLQQRHTSMLRKAVWGERRKMLRTLRIPLEEILIPLQNFLEPEESDPELLHLQLSALVSGAVQPMWSPLLYLVAVHHVNRFLFLDPMAEHQTERAKVKERLWAQVIANMDKMADVIFYKQFSTSQPKGIDLYDCLPPNRQATLDYHISKTKHAHSTC